MDYNFVFSMDNGIGLILNESDGIYKIKYENKIVEEKQFSIQFIDEKLANNLLSKKYESFFKYDYLNRGIEYAETGMVKNFYLLGDTIVGRVSGVNNNKYTQNIKYEKGHFINNCSCPVGKGCKHVVSVIVYISNIMNKLVNNDNNILNNDIDIILNKFNNHLDSCGTLFRLLELKELIKTSDDIEKILKFYEKNYRRIYIDQLLYLIAYVPKINILFNAVSYDIKRKFYCDQIQYEKTSIPHIISTDFKYEYEKKLIYFVLNDNYFDAIKLIISNQYYLNKYNNILPRLSTMVETNQELVDLFLQKYNYSFTYSNSLNTFIKNILKNANIDTKYQIYEKLGTDLDLSVDDISCFSYDKQLKLLSLFRNSNNAVSYINDKIDDFCKNSTNEAIVNTLYLLYEYSIEKNKEVIIDLLDKIDYTYYVKKILMDDYNRFDEIDPVIFFKYLKLSYEIEVNDIDVDIKAYLSIADDKLYSCIISNKNILKHNFIKINFTKECEKQIIDELYNDNNFINDLKEKEDSIKLKKQELLIREYNDKINELNKLINFEAYNQNGLVTLRPEISYYNNELSYNYYQSKTTMTMELKIGRDKFYVVKSAPELLDCIRNHVNYKYGKNLEFNHYINNFDDKSKQLIELLFLIEGKTEYSKYENPRHLPINGIVLEKIFDIYRNDKIIINEKEYYLSNDTIPFKANVDNEYILNTNINYNNTLFTSKNIYYLDNDEYKIIKIDTNDNNLNLYEFLIKNKGMDVSLVLDKFKNDIYSRYSNEIEIANNISDDFKLSALIIDAYFDFNGKAITINPKIYKEDEDTLNLNIADNVKLDRFNNYIKNLGFEDNKISNEDDIYNFLIMDFSELRTICNVFLSESLKNKTITKASFSNIRISYNNSIVDAFLEESIYTEEELYQILASVKKRKKYVLLNNDRIIDINNQEAKDFCDTVEDLKLDLKHLLSKKQIPVYQVIKAISHLNNCEIDDYLKNLINELTKFKEINYELPNINGKLRKYQQEGFNFLKILSKYNLGGILADDMGLGKTLEIITLLLSDDNNMPSIVVCPKSLIFNWLNEIEKFDGNTKVICITGSQNERHKLEQAIDQNKKIIYIIGYNTLSNDLDYLTNINFNYIILDEAQFIKNVSANKTKSVKQLFGIHKCALTGTPIENNIIDLWSIFDFIMPDYLESLDSFRNKYNTKENFLDQIRIKISPFILRRRKEDVLTDLPPKIEHIISVDMTNMQRKLYDAYKLEANKAMELGNGAFEMLPYITRLRQICIDPSTYLENYEGGSGKTDEVLNIIKDYVYDGHRLLIFSSFVQALKIIEVNLNNLNIKYFKITGDTDTLERIELVNQFNKNDSIKVFLISLKAGGTGLNLVGADVVIHLDPWWNLSAENQATDRAHRIGQTKTVEVIKIVCEDSIEQRVIELQNIKKDLIDKVISKNDSSITGFTLEDINFILR